MMLNFVLYYEDSITPIQLSEDMTVDNAKMIICESLGLEYNNTQLFLKQYGQLDNVDVLELPLTVFEITTNTTNHMYVYDENKKHMLHKFFCSRKIIGNNPIEQIGFKLSKHYNIPICLTCSTHCHAGELNLEEDAIINKEFICQCSLISGSNCCFKFQSSLHNDTELVFKAIRELLIQHNEAVKIYENSKNEKIKENVAERIFDFENDIQYGLNKVNNYSNKETIAKIKKIIPQKEEKMGQHDYMKVLLHWFKNDFFTWCDKPKCFQCNESKSHERIRTDRANEYESKYQAKKTEVFLCKQCKIEVRFPRYNSPYKLLDTKTGRCGEWANLFGCIVNAVGYDVRFVNNFEDHVWNEFYSTEEKRWIHIDSCEEAFDKPLLYEQGWGRVMSLIIACGKNEVVDVTRRYIKNWKVVSQRHKIAGRDSLEDTIFAINLSLKENLPLNEKEMIEERAKTEQNELSENNVDKIISDAELLGRQSGSVEWRKERGE